MSLVDYSDSDDDVDPSHQPTVDDKQESAICPITHKRKRSEDSSRKPTTRQVSSLIPPLPYAFASLYASNARSSTSDDPALHEGRQRRVPHISGNWPSFIFLEWIPSDLAVQKLESFVSDIAERERETRHHSTSARPGEIHSSLRTDLGVRMPLHVSLSASLSLTTENKDSFQEDLFHAIQQCYLASFKTSFAKIHWVRNSDDTRSFLVLSLNQPNGNELQSLLSTCNRVAGKYQMPQLYTKQKTRPSILQTIATDDSTIVENSAAVADEQFHVSIAWSLSQPQQNHDTVNLLPDELKSIEISFDRVLLKIDKSRRAHKLILRMLRACHFVEATTPILHRAIFWKIRAGYSSGKCCCNDSLSFEEDENITRDFSSFPAPWCLRTPRADTYLVIAEMASVAKGEAYNGVCAPASLPSLPFSSREAPDLTYRAVRELYMIDLETDSIKTLEDVRKVGGPSCLMHGYLGRPGGLIVRLWVND